MNFITQHNKLNIDYSIGKYFTFLFLIIFPSLLFSQTKNSYLIDSLLKTKPEIFSHIISNPKKFRIQIIYTQIDRDKKNKPTFTQHSYFLDSTNYFYCASLVKLPVSILCLQKINELNINGLDMNAIMFTDSSSACQKNVTIDTSANNGLPSIAQYIKRMLLVSDNLAFGRTYEFLTPDYIHTELAKRGYENIRIIQRFDGGCKGISNLLSNSIKFYGPQHQLLYAQPENQSTKIYNNPLGKVQVGRAYTNSITKKITKPKDFTNSNFMSLQNINDILKNLIFKPYVNLNKTFNIKDSDRNFLLKYLCMLPKESDFPKYNTIEYYDSYKKYFIYGDSKNEIKNKDVRVFNIVGQSYGFMIDCAYIVDFKTKSEFILSAVIYANENETLDGKYEYSTVALPYLSKLGSFFLQYEKKRTRNFYPNLDEFK